MKTTREALDALPTGSSFEVAIFLVEHGFKGNAGKAFSCPIARYLKSETGKLHAVTSDTSCPIEDGIGDAQVNPPAVETFIYDFDFGNYPGLEE